MTGHFLVHVERLDRMLTQLRDGADRMSDALRAMEDVGPKSTGSRRLDGACDDFSDEWHYAIDKIREGTSEIAGKLEQTRNGYQQTEEAIRQVFQPPDGSAPSPSPSPTPAPTAPTPPDGSSPAPAPSPQGPPVSTQPYPAEPGTVPTPPVTTQPAPA
ncbi:WXG100 family type VII secretion target [Allostreptomyces psammosilenae]|uniref:Uncharacterized protein n=1 Tax=Allostreptomyces psammosilenae TaxID=1892865 RepID=A0A853A050_9ACTN|nr:hypothetical protein [Allostreptomyces psammosilenae]NYI08003.1 hypothetical protein [Allostreptomyces psammosilenae]